MILQRIRIIEGDDAGFEPRTSAPEVWCATYMSHHIKVKAYLEHVPSLSLFLHSSTPVQGRGWKPGGR